MVIGRFFYSDRRIVQTGMCWRFDLPEEWKKRMIRGGQAVNDSISISLLEVMAMVMTAYVMLDMRGEKRFGKGTRS